MKPRKQDDSYAFTGQIRDANGPFNLTGYTVTINIVIKAPPRTQIVTNGFCTLTDAVNGRWSYLPSSGDVAALVANAYDVELKLVAGALRYRAPTDGYDQLYVRESLG